MVEADAIVIGAGVMGSSTAWWLARAGKSVLILERFEVGHERGSSHGASRVFRFSYDQAAYVEMAMEAQRLWREAESEADTALLVGLGGIDFGDGIERNAAAMAAAGATHEVIDGAEAMRRFPRIAVPAADPVVFQPDAGIALADRAVRTFIDMAVARGAELREGLEVREVLPGEGSVEVRTEGDEYRAPVAVVTAGAWARPLAATAGIDLPVAPSRETVSYHSLPDEFGLPILIEWGAHPFYGLPDPGRGLKAGGHHLGPEADPDEPGEVDPETVAALAEWARTHYPDVEPEPWRAETCLYTNTSDETFVLERHGPVVIGSACSGHGFKFAPLIGKHLAELAVS